MSESNPRPNTNTNGRPNEVPKVFIPDILPPGWPWSRQLNPLYVELKEESDAWAASLQPYSPRVQKIVDRANYSLLICLAHPTLNREHGRAACDLMHFLFAVDDYAERYTPCEVRKSKKIMFDAFRNPYAPRLKEEPVFGEMAHQFWANHMQNVADVTLERFIRHLDEYMESVVQEIIDKEQNRILDVKSYLALRRLTAGITPFFSINELGFDIPDEVMSLSTIQAMVQIAPEIIACCNDVASYNVEQMRGDALHNVITCLMNEYHTDINGAILWVQNHVWELGRKFLAAMGSLPQWEEPLNSQVREYCDGLGQWVQANWEWSFETGRYLGSRGTEIKKNKWMSLLPKMPASEEVGPMGFDDSFL